MKNIKYIETSARECTPSQTLDYVEKMKIIGDTGIVPKIFRADMIDRFGVPVYLSFSKKVNGEGIDLNFTHAGKGATAAEAKCSAIFEAIERYSAKMEGNERLLVAPNGAIENAVNLERFIPGSSALLDSTLEWTEANVAGKEGKKYVPANYVYFPYRPIGKEISMVLPHDTNGLAAGNSINEALVHATYEVVEKDAFCIFWNNSTIYPNVNLDELKNNELIEIINILKTNNANVVIKDITTDIKIPSFAAILDCRKIEEPAFVYGSGTHLDPEIAILRAITEALQLRVSQMILLKYKPDIRYKKVSGLGSDSHDIIENMVTKDAAKFVEPMLYGKNVSISGYERYTFNCIEESFDKIVNIINERGYDVLYKDISKDVAKFPAVRVLIPGLQPSTGLPSRRSERINIISSMIMRRNL
ncbi:YcaO-like family protein [Thomasclavelia cocleata]|uniref:YcaO-like family protein n=1 Tax=Thomasclavelia cocleata TaxID=69824 RepID=UPI00272E48AE|nr:YcaO-like family protein [Thomasclavelia cocleata]